MNQHAGGKWLIHGTKRLKKAESVVQKVINGHKNPNDSHNYHDEKPDEIEFYLGNSDKST